MRTFVTGTVSLGPSPSPIAASPLSPRGNCLEFQFIYICAYNKQCELSWQVLFHMYQVPHL